MKQVFTPAFELSYSRDNGSVPPPYRRETEIQVDRAGAGIYLRRCGYEREGVVWRAGFHLDERQRAAFLSALAALPLTGVDWSPEQPTVGGPTTLIEIQANGLALRTPARLRPEQHELVDALRALIQDLVPSELREQARSWEAQLGIE